MQTYMQKKWAPPTFLVLCTRNQIYMKHWKGAVYLNLTPSKNKHTHTQRVFMAERTMWCIVRSLSVDVTNRTELRAQPGWLKEKSVFKTPQKCAIPTTMRTVVARVLHSLSLARFSFAHVCDIRMEKPYGWVIISCFEVKHLKKKYVVPMSSHRCLRVYQVQRLNHFAIQNNENATPLCIIRQH